MITAVTTCMGRLEHLQTTLPLMLSEFERVIVVDYSCPQDSGHWAEREGADVVYRRYQDVWNAPKARNFGAKEVYSDYVCFIDADTMIMPGTRVEIESLLNETNMVVASRNAQNIDVANLNGFIAVSMDNFKSVKGYKEELEGYGIEDGYLRAQLTLEKGLSIARLSPGCLGAIRHSDELRGKFVKEPLKVSAVRNMNILLDYLKSKGVTDWQNDPRTAEMAYR